MIAFLVKLTVLLAAGWIGTVSLRSRAAALRHLVWTATLAAAIALAALYPVLPPLAVPVPGFQTIASTDTGSEPRGEVASDYDEHAVLVDSDAAATRSSSCRQGLEPKRASSPARSE